MLSTPVSESCGVGELVPAELIRQLGHVWQRVSVSMSHVGVRTDQNRTDPIHTDPIRIDRIGIVPRRTDRIGIVPRRTVQRETSP